MVLEVTHNRMAGAAGVTNEQRAILIGVGSAAFDEESRTRPVLCSRAAFVSGFLRNIGQTPLSSSEAAAFDRGAVGLARSAARPSDRQLVINTALACYDEESRSKTVLCTRRDWVDQFMRDTRQPLLTDAEFALLSQSGSPGAFPGNAGSGRSESRADIAQQAAAEYAAERSKGVDVGTSMVNWVNQALRDAGYPIATDDEIKNWSLEAE